MYVFLIKKPGRRLSNLHFGRIPSSDYFPCRDCLLEAVKTGMQLLCISVLLRQEIGELRTCRRIELEACGWRHGRAIGKVQWQK